ncbi:MAG: DUF4154 domain-containing protein [Deltaproteobacteria bacterium]|nr:DUF4154 domain-containing protein [Deltaproteobacteria bacterium]
MTLAARCGLLLTAVAVATVARAEIPVDRAAQLLFRALAYERRIVANPAPEALISVVTRTGGVAPACVAIKQELQQLALQTPVGKRRAKVGYLAFIDAKTFGEALRRVKPDAVLVCGGLEPAVPSIAEATREHKVLSFGMSRAMVDAGLSVALDDVRGRPGLVVNLANARAEGAALDASLLQVSDVIR